MEEASTAYLRRKLHYLCRRRATQELELILGEFWRKHGASLNEQDLHDLEAILSLDDFHLLQIVLGQKPIPEGYRKDLFQRIVRIQRESGRTDPG